MKLSEEEIIENRVLVTCDLLRDAWVSYRYLCNYCIRNDTYSGLFQRMEADTRELKNIKNRLMQMKEESTTVVVKKSEQPKKRWFQFWR